MIARTAPPGPRTGAPVASQRRIRLVIADDEPVVRQALVELLQATEYFQVVGVAGDAETAIDLARVQQPDVALLDVRMPGGGAERAAREIPRRCQGTRIVAISAYPDRSSVVAMLKAGADGFLVKGSPAEHLVAALRRFAAAAPPPGGEAWDSPVAPEVDLDSEEREARIERIRTALDEGRIRMVFQPVVDLAAGTVVGFEALARFSMAPRRGPALWFADAASVGLLTDLEIACVDVALEHLARLPVGTYLSVNLSPASLISRTLAERLREVSGDRLVIELADQAPGDDIEEVAGLLTPLRDEGARLAIGGAGTTFRSLRHMVELRPELIKLDGTLTHRVEGDQVRQAVVAGLVSLARKMEAEVVAQDIETREQLDQLRRLGVRYGQGFLLGRPRPWMAADPSATGWALPHPTEEDA